VELCWGWMVWVTSKKKKKSGCKAKRKEGMRRGEDFKGGEGQEMRRRKRGSEKGGARGTGGEGMGEGGGER